MTVRINVALLIKFNTYVHSGIKIVNMDGNGKPECNNWRLKNALNSIIPIYYSVVNSRWIYKLLQQ